MGILEDVGSGVDELRQIVDLCGRWIGGGLALRLGLNLSESLSLLREGVSLMGQSGEKGELTVFSSPSRRWRFAGGVAAAS